MFRLPNMYISSKQKKKSFFFNKKTRYFDLKKYKFQSKTLKYSNQKKEIIPIRKKKMIIPNIEWKLRIEQKKKTNNGKKKLSLGK